MLDIELKEMFQLANEHHNLAIRSVRSSLVHARDSGEQLATIKKKCKHGQFEKLIEEMGEMVPRTAQRYIQIFREYPAIEEQMGPGKAATISLSEGIRAIRQREQVYYPPDKDEKPASALLEDVDEDLTVCPRNGVHEYEEDDDCCKHCHTPKDAITEAQAAREALDLEVEQKKAARELATLFAKTESMYCQLTQQLDKLQKLQPYHEKEGIQTALALSYDNFRKWRYGK